MTHLYFQPQYVSRFQCDGSKCNARCCRNWYIFFDEAAYRKYAKLDPQIVSHLQFDDKLKLYRVTLDERNACPFLDADNLCKLQRNYGDDYLSSTCATYPRYTRDFGNFFERALTLSCPVAAQMILTNDPMQFELVNVDDKNHSNGGKIAMLKVKCGDGLAERMLETQIAMISILQARQFTIDQRLIVLGFFMDKLDEITADGVNEFALLKLIDAYESKQFLTENVPRMLQTVRFDPRRFVGLMLRVIDNVYGNINSELLDAVTRTLRLQPDENQRVRLTNVVANYQSLAPQRKAFLAENATLLENYLVNELFLNCYPWRFDHNITGNFAMFVTIYKILELLLFANGGDLVSIVVSFAGQFDHSGDLQTKIFRQIDCADDLPALLDTLLEP